MKILKDPFGNPFIGVEFGKNPDNGRPRRYKVSIYDNSIFLVYEECYPQPQSLWCPKEGWANIPGKPPVSLPLEIVDAVKKLLKFYSLQ